MCIGGRVCIVYILYTLYPIPYTIPPKIPCSIFLLISVRRRERTPSLVATVDDTLACIRRHPLRIEMYSGPASHGTSSLIRSVARASLPVVFVYSVCIMCV